MATSRSHHHAVSWKRRDFLLAAFVALVALSVHGGCSGRDVNVCSEPLDMRFDANADSLGLAEFLALGSTERRARRALARSYLANARDAGRVDLRLRYLTTAAGLTPDDPDLWLELARVWRWQGNYLAHDNSLSQSAVAVRELNPNSPVVAERGLRYKKTAALEIALQRAWLHYDRAEWREAMPWVRAAVRVEHGNAAVLQIRGLLEARLGHRGMAFEIADDLQRKSEFNANANWIRSNVLTVEDRHRAAYNAFLRLRPEPRNAAEAYRDMGRAAERVAEWSSARRWYQESAAALPYKSISCRTKREDARVSDAAERHRLPFWLAFDRYYVTGSLSSYLAYAFERFETAQSAADRNEWGGLVVNAAGICLRLEMEEAHARRARGLVFAGTERNDRALSDLRAALRELGAGDALAPRLEAEIGHLLLVSEDHATAVAHLRRALAADATAAQVWSDLGLALIMSGDRGGAEEALTRAIALDETLAAAWYNRGLMHLHAGDLVQAEADLGQAATLAPDNSDVADLLQQVVLEKRRHQSP